MFFQTYRSDGMTEFSLGVLLRIGLDLAPVPFVVTNFLQNEQLGIMPYRRASCKMNIFFCFRLYPFVKVFYNMPFAVWGPVYKMCLLTGRSRRGNMTGAFPCQLPSDGKFFSFLLQYRQQIFIDFSGDRQTLLFLKFV